MAVVLIGLLGCWLASPAGAQEKPAPPPKKAVEPGKGKAKNKGTKPPAKVPETPKTPPAPGKDLLILFPATGDVALADLITNINAEIFMVADGAGRFTIINPDELGESLMMDAAEALSFCNEEPGCIADIGKDRGAKWICFGDIKYSFDKTKVIAHLVLVDVVARKVSVEKFGQIEKEKNVVLEAGNVMRDLLGIPRPQPKTPPPVAKGPEDKAPEEKASETALAVKVVAPPPPPPRSRWANPWFWTTLGVGVAAGAAGGTLGYLSYAKLDDAKASADQPTAYPLVQDSKKYALGANILFGVAGGAAIGALLILLLDNPEQDPTPVPAVTPTVTPTGSGVGASLLFSF
jgi:hypothetical protein